MNIINCKVKDNVLYLCPEGRIDSSNASAAQTTFDGMISANPAENVLVDADKLEYISSAGLRVILHLRKLIPGLKIINVSSDVYEIFEMTGFTEMIPVEKGYRKLSVEGCEVIGKGANGQVYRLDPDTIIKVYLNPDSLPDIHRERELARRAFVLGVPTAIPYDVVRVGEGYGSVFELLNAKSFTQILAADPSQFDNIVGMYVELLKLIHSTEVLPGDMPDMKQVVTGWAAFLKDYLPAEKWEKLAALVAAVPEDHHMIHGDYHTKNVMLQNGEALLIDMDTLAQGNPVFEFASIYNAYIGFADLDHSIIQKFLGISYEMAGAIWKETLRRYFGTDDAEKLQTIQDKSALVGYTRLMRRQIRRGDLDTEEGRKRVNYYRDRITALIDRLDTLCF